MGCFERGTLIMILRDYALTNNYPVLFWVSVGNPLGEHTILRHPDFKLAEDLNWLDLVGNVDSENNWSWNGEGKPCDVLANSITKLEAFCDSSLWLAIEKDWEMSY